jgi:hypothetical protein
MRIHFDEDEWETVSEHRACTTCGGDLRKCNGGCNGSSGYGMRRRDPKDVAAIKAKRQREHEDKILAEADAIRARRRSP